MGWGGLGGWCEWQVKAMEGGAVERTTRDHLQCTLRLSEGVGVGSIEDWQKDVEERAPPGLSFATKAEVSCHLCFKSQQGPAKLAD